MSARCAGLKAVGAVTVLAVIPLLVRSNYLVGVLTVAVIYGLWAASWDFMSLRQRPAKKACVLLGKFVRWLSRSTWSCRVVMAGQC